MTATVDLPFVGRTALAEAERAALSVFVIRIVGAALAYGAQVLLARLLGKAEYGVFATVWVWTNVLGHGGGEQQPGQAQGEEEEGLDVEEEHGHEAHREPHGPRTAPG